MTKRTSRLLRGFCALILTLALGRAWALEVVRVGVLAARPAAEMQLRWQPFIDHLNQHVPGYRFHAEMMGYVELEAAIARHEIDFVLTNPSHYVLMTYRNGLSSPLATLMQTDWGHQVKGFGGVIFTRAERNEFARLADLRGKTLAVVSTGSLGGYQAQALELLQAGLKIPQDVRILQTGMPHDAVVQAVLAGRADAGCVRTGVLEAMAAEGKLDLRRVKVLQAKQVPRFPLRLSTRLYPEWPFAAMPNVDENLARHVAAVLLGLPHGGELARRIGIHGFSIPADYEPVRNLLQALRQPPFDVAPHFTLADIWQKYWWELLALIVLGSVILLLILQLALLNRRLGEQRRAADRRAEEWHGLLAALGDGVYGVDAHGLCTFINPAALTMLGLSEDEVLGRDQHELFHHHHEDGSPYPAAECPIAMTLADGRLRRCEEWFMRKDGHGFPIMLVVNPVAEAGSYDGAVVVFRDISERRRLEQELRDEATTDALTRLPNRRYFLAEMDRHLAHLHRGEAQPAAIMMLDLDCFKAVNDTHGHAVGDQVLAHFASLLRDTLRKGDLVGRLGGEEFAVLQPDTGMEQAGQFAERLRQRVMASPLVIASQPLHYTVSIGVSLMTASDRSVDAALLRADMALYGAKGQGRNRVTIVAPPEAGEAVAGVSG